MGIFKAFAENPIELYPTGKIIGRCKSTSLTVDNSPIDNVHLEGRSVEKYSGGLKVSSKIDRRHSLIIDSSMFEMALGKPLIENGQLKHKLWEELNTSHKSGQTAFDTSLSCFFVSGIGGKNYKIAQRFKLIGESDTRILEELAFVASKTGLLPSLPLDVSLHLDNATDPNNPRPGAKIGLSLGTIPPSDLTSSPKWVSIKPNRSVTGCLSSDIFWIVLSTTDVTVDAYNIYYNSVENNYSFKDTVAYGIRRNESEADEWAHIVNYDLAFGLLATIPNHLKLSIVTYDPITLLKETVTLLKSKIVSNDFEIRASEILMDSGSIESEDITVVVGAV